MDFLAAGRVAGRYVISVGDVAASLSVITIVANCEATYRAGSAMSFWGILPTLLGMFLSLSGYCVYRWRATRALSFGQFLEMRYNRTFRVFAAVLRNLTEMVANAIGPAIAANFFVYFLGLPHKIQLFGRAVPTFALIVGACILFAMVALWPAGRISLLVTDTVQGMLAYPIFALVAAWIFFHFDWKTTMEPVMVNRVAGESFLNPFDIDKLRDFNLFALGVWLMSTVLQRASWFGNDTSSAGRTPHEQKMAGVLGSWRNGYAYTMIGLVTLLVITVMNHGRYVLPGKHGGFSSHETRVALLNKVAAETVPDPAARDRIAAALDALPARLQDEPLSQLHADPVRRVARRRRHRDDLRALHPLRQHGRRLVLHRVRVRLLARRARHAARLGVARRAVALAPRLDGGRLPVLREPFAPVQPLCRLVLRLQFRRKHAGAGAAALPREALHQLDRNLRPLDGPLRRRLLPRLLGGPHVLGTAVPGRGGAVFTVPPQSRTVWADVEWVAGGETNTAWRHLHLYGDGKGRRYFFDGAAPVRWGANYPNGNLAEAWDGDIVSFRVFNNKTKEEVPVRDLRIVPGDPGLPPELIISHAKASARWTPPRTFPPRPRR